MNVDNELDVAKIITTIKMPENGTFFTKNIVPNR